MAISLESGRQGIISAYVDVTPSEFDTTIIGTANTSLKEAINLPYNAIIIGGDLVVQTPWNTVGVLANGVLTSTAAPADTNTVTIGSQVYTFKTALTASTTANEVLIGVSEATSLNNLAAAINAGPGAGVVYGSLTVKNANVSAVSDGVHTLTVTSLVASTANDTLATTETHANATWGGATLVDYVVPADTFTIKIGNETYLSATTIDTTGLTALVPTGTKLTVNDTLDIIWDVANTTTVAPTAGAATLQIRYIIVGRADFSQS